MIMQEMTRPPQPEQSNVAALLESESKDFLNGFIASLPADQREAHLRYLIAASGYFLKASVVGKNVLERAYMKPLKSIHFLFECAPQAFELFAKKLLVEEVAVRSSSSLQDGTLIDDRNRAVLPEEKSRRTVRCHLCYP